MQKIKKVKILCFLLFISLITSANCIGGGSWSEEKREFHCGLRWGGSCSIKKTTKTVPVIRLDEINYYEGSGEIPKRSSSNELFTLLAKFRLLKTRQSKLEFLRKQCKKILKITKYSSNFGINKACRQNIPL